MTERDKHPHPSDRCGGTRLTETGSYSPEDPALPVCRQGPWFPGPLVLLESPGDTQTDEDDEETSVNAEFTRLSSYLLQQRAPFGLMPRPFSSLGTNQ